MKQKTQNLITVCAAGAVLFGLSLWGIFGSKRDFSDSERRVLAQLPELSAQTLLSGKFMSEFETYALDQFPMRDTFRTIKSASVLGLFGQMETNGLYLQDGYLARAETTLNEEMIDYAAERFAFLYDSFLADTDANVYFSIVPDKHYFLSQESGRLSMDYERFVELMCNRTEQMEYIDIFPMLSIEDYYRTDTHWRQECIGDVAQTIAAAMGVTLSAQYKTLTLPNPFYGVYYGQLALPVKPDSLSYLNNAVLDSCIVTSYDTGLPVEKQVYDMEKAQGRDPYEMFLCGSDALLTIENPNAATDKELVVFRDSFGSSLIPLLVEAYARITLVDIRYVQSAAVGSFVDFDDQDVLFLYSTLVLNSSTSLK